MMRAAIASMTSPHASPEFPATHRVECLGSLPVAVGHDNARPIRIKIPDKPAREIFAIRIVHAGFPGTRGDGVVSDIETLCSGWMRTGMKYATAVAALAASSGYAYASGGADVSPAIYQLMVFVIAIFVGYFVVWGVTPALHTPLMAVTNAISSVIVVGALLAAGVGLVGWGSGLAKFFGFLALVMAAVNIFGGFLVTQRMLAMYKKKEKK
jgi:H+-translocating NAD(P) transhydrogenase subunit alpha